MDDRLVLRHDETELLRRKVERLESELDSAHEALRAARSQSAAANNALKNLRKHLEPTYTAFRMLFGELDAANISGSGDPINPKASAVWEKWKQDLPGKRADFIQALLDHGEMTGTQLRIATRTAAGSVAGIIHDLKRAGLINKNGDKYSLKELG